MITRCRKVQRLLDDYLRGELTSRDRESVASHLASCVKCGAELEFLKSYREELASIPAHRVPEGFLGRVRDGLSAGNEKIIPARDRGIIERLFFPLKIKLPLEAAGLLATAFLVIVFMRPFLDEPGRQTRREIQDSTAAAPEARERKEKAAKYHVAVNSLKQKTRLYRPSEEKPVPPVEIDLAVGAQQQSRDGFASDALRSVKEEREAPVTPGARGQVAETARSRSSKADTAGGIAPSRQATVQLAGEDRIVQIKNMIGPLGGRIISENRSMGKNKPAYIRVKLPETNYARFVEQLGQVGQVTRRPAQRAVQNRRSIDVQVNVLEQK